MHRRRRHKRHLGRLKRVALRKQDAQPEGLACRPGRQPWHLWAADEGVCRLERAPCWPGTGAGPEQGPAGGARRAGWQAVAWKTAPAIGCSKQAMSQGTKAPICGRAAVNFYRLPSHSSHRAISAGMGIQPVMNGTLRTHLRTAAAGRGSPALAALLPMCVGPHTVPAYSHPAGAAASLAARSAQAAQQGRWERCRHGTGHSGTP